MSAPPPPPKPGGGLSLYADLLDPPGDSAASISRAPQVSKQALDAVKEQEAAKKTDAALRFQPIQNIRRPQQKSQKPKPTFPKAGLPGATTANNVSAAPAAGGGGGGGNGAAAPAPVKSTLADWANTGDDDEWMYAGDKRPRGSNKKKKKKTGAPIETDWNEIYDPSRPTNVDEYLRSDERILEVREWKALLYRHRKPTERKRQSSWDSEEDEDRPTGNQFAPPPSYSFAPPPVSPPRAAPAAAPLPDDKTGDDAYARRLAMSQGIPPPPPPPIEPSHAEPPIPATAPPPPPPEPDASTISRAPVRYTQPLPPPEPTDPDAMDEDIPEPHPETEDAPRTSRPGQKGFAARLMSKYGWSKGQGLGAEGTGILAPIRVQVEKRKKRSDAEGGGWAEPGGRGKIIEPRANPNANTSESSAADQAGKFGRVSNVIVLQHMLDNIEDLQKEIEDGLGQEIGEECGDNYGRVERLYIDTSPGGSRNVYIKFVDTVSALRAVNALDGRVFAGSSIEPRYYDVELFEKGVYE